MGKFLNGLFLGVGAGLLIAPMRGEDMRNLISERFQGLRNSFSGSEEHDDPYAPKTYKNTSSMGSNLKESTQQTASQIKSAGNQLGDMTRQANSNIGQTGKDAIDNTKQASQQAKRDMGGRPNLS